MRPKDLKSPFKWDERKVILRDRVWFVPDYLERYDDFTFPGFNAAEMFGNNNPVHIEYCSGNGSWIAEKAMQSCDINWVAVEKRFDRTRKIWSKVKNEKVDNLVAVCGDGQVVTHHYFCDESVDAIYINFPDPWPKTKHHKNRIINEEFLKSVCRVLKHGGSLTFVTDDADYSDYAIGQFEKNGSFVSQFGDKNYSEEMSGYGSSYFEDLWRSKGLKIRYHNYKKVL